MPPAVIIFLVIVAVLVLVAAVVIARRTRPNVMCTPVDTDEDEHEAWLARKRAMYNASRVEERDRFEGAFYDDFNAP